MISEENRRPPFDSLQPLLPQELCWIMDRSFAYEVLPMRSTYSQGVDFLVQMEWHAGNLLSNTVFTLVYVHELSEFDPDLIPYHDIQNTTSRPIELISVVLRTYILGLLKCCGVAWDELNRSSLHDVRQLINFSVAQTHEDMKGEDWQADKCEVSLLEGYQVKSALVKIEETLNWISHTTKSAPGSRYFPLRVLRSSSPSAVERRFTRTSQHAENPSQTHDNELV